MNNFRLSNFDISGYARNKDKFKPLKGDHLKHLDDNIISQLPPIFICNSEGKVINTITQKSVRNNFVISPLRRRKMKIILNYYLLLLVIVLNFLRRLE